MYCPLKNRQSIQFLKIIKIMKKYKNIVINTNNGSYTTGKSNLFAVKHFNQLDI